MNPPLRRRAAGRCGSAPAPGRTVRVRTVLTAAWLLCLSPFAGAAASAGEAEDGDGAVRYDRLAILGTTGVAAHWVGFEYFDRAWYQGQRRDSIRWLHDWSGDTYLHMDKGGHFLGGMFLSNSLGDAFRWSGFRPRPAAALGAAVSWAVLFEVEMRDAYFDQWGFSVPDFAANTAGVAVPLAHAWFPSTRIVGFKWSWWPSPLYRDYDERLAAGRPRTQYAIDDYEGMTYWLTLAVNDLMPSGLEARWPDWLGLALGYGATGMHGANVKSRGREREYEHLPDARSEILLSLDYDSRSLPGRGWFMHHFKQQLQWVRLPAPAVRVHPDLRFYLLYL